MRGGLFARAAAAGGVRGRGRRGRHDARAGRRRRGGGAGRAACRLRADRARGGAGVHVPPAAGVLEGGYRRSPLAGAGRGRGAPCRAALPRGRRRGARGHLRGGVPPPRGRIRRLLPERARALSLHGRAGGAVYRRRGIAGGGGGCPRARRARGGGPAAAPFAPPHPRGSQKGGCAARFLYDILRRGRQPRPQHRAGGVAAERLRAGGGRGALLQRARGRAHRAKRLPRSARHRARRVCRGGGRRRVPGQHHPLQRRPARGAFRRRGPPAQPRRRLRAPLARRDGQRQQLRLESEEYFPRPRLHPRPRRRRRAHRAGVRAGERRHLRHRERGHRPHPAAPARGAGGGGGHHPRRQRGCAQRGIPRPPRGGPPERARPPAAGQLRPRARHLAAPRPR